MMMKMITIAGACMTMMLATSASAETRQVLDIERLALEPDGLQKKGTVEFERMYVPHIVVAPRVEDAAQARFDVAIRNWPMRSVLLLTVESVGEDSRYERWRCVAVSSIEECLSDKQSFQFLPTDDRIVLTAVALPSEDSEALAFLQP
jgi:hypothetical protein